MQQLGTKNKIYIALNDVSAVIIVSFWFLAHKDRHVSICIHGFKTMILRNNICALQDNSSGKMASCGGAGKMQFENDDHTSALLEEMKYLYDNNLLTDVTLRVEQLEFCCHRNMLAATSPYFKAMFTTRLTESKMDSINLYEVDAWSVKQVIEYAYTGKLEITKHNAQNLLAAASLFQISPIHTACAKFMETQLDAHNCIGIQMFAHVHSCEELRLKAMEYVEKNFYDVCHTEEFLSLTADRLAEIVASDELNVECEEVVFEAILRWVRHSEAERHKYLGDLLPNVRLCLLNMKYINDNIRQNHLVKRCPKCLRLLRNLEEFEKNPDHYKGEHRFNISLRSGMIKPEHCLLFIGGVDQNRPSINCYNPLTRETFFMADFPEMENRSGYYSVEDPACVVTEDNLIFVAGGNYLYRDNWGETPSDEESIEEFEEEDVVRKDFYQYDNDHNMWVHRAPMLFPKSNFTLAYADQKIYCFGGLTVNQHPTEIIECYDIIKNRWNYVGMMPTTLVDLTSVTHNGKIYILGGRTGVGAHNVVMRYDPKKAEWTPMAGMPTPRFKFGACVVGDEIYVAGGQIYSHSSHTITREALKSVEIYNMEENQWRQGPELNEDMYNCGLALINNNLYACGTTEYQRSPFRIYRYNTVCRLDMVKNRWDQIESDLCDIHDFSCVAARLHTRKLSQVFRPEVDT